METSEKHPFDRTCKNSSENTESTQSALLVINTMTYFVGLVETGRMLQKKSKYKPIFYFTQPYPKYQEDLAICEKERMRYICGFQKIPLILGGDSSRLTPKQDSFKKFCLYFYGIFFVGFLYEMFSYFKEFSKIRALIRKSKPTILIIAGDNIGYNTNILVKICHDNKIPSLIIPLWMAGPAEAAEAYFHNPLYDARRLSNRILGFFDPKWLYSHKGKKMIRWPAFKILAMKLFGLEPPLPWILNSSYADSITAECEEMAAFMKREGIPLKQITVTGSLANDIMAENIRDYDTRKKNLFERLNLEKDKPLLLCALPPNILYGYSRPECDFSTYGELVEFWIKSLANIKNYNVVISLHPAIKYEEIRSIEDFGVTIALEKIIDLIPYCDLFVAAMSGTIHWATACGKPVLNYDVYKFRYKDFLEYKGILYADQKDHFTMLLQKLTHNNDFYLKILHEQKSNSRQWGILDGKCGNRILQRIDTLVKQYSC
ncbi:hypothetical protein HYV57_00755 [Candidatus Peregrinibacteria bacterium]|nr:hypothetical protein [Candidatus Peregrinibacteria bacterium]